MMACNAILLALLSRERTGKGQQLEVALFDTAILMTSFASMQQLLTGRDPQRHGNTSPDTCPSGVFEASDRPFYINCGNDKIFQRLFTEVVDRPEIASHPEYARSADRLQRRDDLFRILNEEFAAHPWAFWQQRLRAASIPHGEVRTLSEALTSGEVQSRGLVTRIPHPVLGWIPNVNTPIRLGDCPAVEPKAAPAVGQHTDEVLREVLKYDDARVAELRRQGAFGGA
jgi:crotonobetainyl-CoA:carnitine CoA-transferase CaiB-like acyl-CoA transferase